MPEIAKVPTAGDIQRILDRRAQALAKVHSAHQAAEETIKILTFPAGDEWFGVEVEFVREIQPLKRQEWSRVPCTPDFIVGAVNVRGRIYSLMNVARYVGTAKAIPSENAHVLLVRGENGLDGEAMVFCILADSLPRFEQFSAGDLQPPSETLSAKAQMSVKGITRDMVMLLDTARLMSDPGIIVDADAQ